MSEDLEYTVRIDKIANGAVGDLMSLLGTNIRLNKIEVISATVENYISTDVKTLSVTYRIKPELNSLGDRIAD